MKYAIIENNTVVNIAVAEQPLADNWIEAGSAAIGDTYENGQFSKPVPVVDPLAYQAERAAEYPPMTDYIDGIVKGDQAQVQAYIDACLAVKAKYPKPA
jgi:hypothetical protein